MSKEQKLTAFILKKQAFNEADEIITFFSKEQGKVRALAKSVKLAKSKLQAKLQNLFLVNVNLAGSHSLPKVTAAEPIEVFFNLRENLETVKLGIYASELVLKFTGDEEVNEPLFLALKNFLEQLNLAEQKTWDRLLLQFKLAVLDACGVSYRGQLKTNNQNLAELNHQVSEFIEYQLERKVKSEKFLAEGML